MRLDIYLKPHRACRFDMFKARNGNENKMPFAAFLEMLQVQQQAISRREKLSRLQLLPLYQKKGKKKFILIHKQKY